MGQYNKESVDGIYLERAGCDALKAAGPGAFTYTYEETEDGTRGRIIGMIHYLPGAGYGHINIRPYSGSAAAWDWDGNIEKPTLHPSVNAKPAEPHGDYPGRVGWHGWLRNGRWESV